MGRKVDPGPLFPWRTLAEAGVGLWVPPGGEHGSYAVAVDETGEDARALLRRIGYAVDPLAGGSADPVEAAKKLRFAVQAFQMHWRPSNISSDVDPETLATMRAVAAAFDV